MASMCASSVLFLIRSFLCPAVINGEKATLETPTFAQKRQRTLDMLIRSLYQDLMPDLHKVQLLSWPPVWSRDLFLPILGWMYFSVIQAVPVPVVTSVTGSDCRACWLAFCCIPLQPPVCLCILHHTGWILLQCWLSQQGSLSSHHFCS